MVRVQNIAEYILKLQNKGEHVQHNNKIIFSIGTNTIKIASIK